MLFYTLMVTFFVEEVTEATEHCSVFQLFLWPYTNADLLVCLKVSTCKLNMFSRLFSLADSVSCIRFSLVCKYFTQLKTPKIRTKMLIPT